MKHLPATHILSKRDTEPCSPDSVADRIMPPRLQAVQSLPNYQLLLTFAHGEQRQFDMNPYLEKGVFAELKDESLFRSVRVSFDTIEWPNGADLCPEVLYAMSFPPPTCTAGTG